MTVQRTNSVMAADVGGLLNTGTVIPEFVTGIPAINCFGPSISSSGPPSAGGYGLSPGAVPLPGDLNSQGPPPHPGDNQPQYAWMKEKKPTRKQLQQQQPPAPLPQPITPIGKFPETPVRCHREQSAPRPPILRCCQCRGHLTPPHRQGPGGQ